MDRNSIDCGLLINHSPARALQHKTPEEVWIGKKPNLSHLRVFECRAMSHVSKENRKKWGMKSEECIFLDYLEESKGYHLYQLSSQKVIKSRDVVFLVIIRKRKLKRRRTRKAKIFPSTTCQRLSMKGAPDESLNSSSSSSSEYHIDMGSELDTDENGDDKHQPNVSIQELLEQLRRSSRKSIPKRFNDYVTYKATDEILIDLITIKEVLESSNCVKWKKTEEYGSHRKWYMNIDKTTADRKALKNKWVLKQRKILTVKLNDIKLVSLSKITHKSKGLIMRKLTHQSQGTDLLGFYSLLQPNTTWMWTI